jgi:20S proteasome alpha/beta subunit
MIDTMKATTRCLIMDFRHRLLVPVGLMIGVILIFQHVPIAGASQAAGQETLVALVGEDFILIGADSSVSQSIALTASNLDKIAVLVEPFTFDDPRPRPIGAQQTIVAAAAGDAADADRMVAMLQSQATLQEYQASVGCDVDFISFDDEEQKENDHETGSLPHVLDQQQSAGLTVEAMAHLARGQISRSLRTSSRMNVCLLIAGMMPVVGATGESPLAFSVSDRIQRQVREAWTSKSKSSTATATVAVTPVDTSPKEKTFKFPTVSLQPRLYWLDEYGSLQRVQYGAHGYGSNFLLSLLDQGYRTNMSREEAVKLMGECFQQLRTRYVINSPQPPCIKCVDARGCLLLR